MGALTPNGQFEMHSTLAHLATDALQCICNQLESIDLGRLWLTGNELLALKLRRSVTRIDFEARPLGYGYPNLVAEFTSLEKFSMRFGPYSYLTPETGFDPAIIPKSSKHIELHLYPCSEAFFGHLAQNVASFSHLVTLVCSNPSLLDHALGSSLTSLTQLETLRASFNILNLSHLPASLTSLDAMFLTLKSNGHAFGPNLRTLTWRTSSTTSLTGLLLDGLESLLLYHPNLWTSAEIQALPRGLTSLANINVFEWTTHHLAALPPRLTLLRSPRATFESALCSHLPKTLTECSNLTGEVGAKDIANLPPLVRDYLNQGKYLSVLMDAIPLFPASVTSLKLDDIPNLDRIDFLPSTLKALNVRFLNTALAHKLPRALEILTIIDGPTYIEALEHLPSTLTELRTVSLRSSSKSPISIDSLPTSLKVLVHENKGNPSQNPKWLTMAETIKLPQLQTLHANKLAFTPTVLGGFTSLVEFFITTSSIPLGATKLLPRSLTTLRVALAAPQQGVAHDVLTTLPIYLINFAYDLITLPAPPSARKEITNASMSALPFTLASCRLPDTSLTKDCLPKLPKHLRALTTGGRVPEWFPLNRGG